MRGRELRRRRRPLLPPSRRPSLRCPQIPSNSSIATADTSKVATDLKPVVACLTEAFGAVQQAYAGVPSKKREVDDNSRRLGILFWKLNLGDIKPSVRTQLLELCKALSSRDFGTAQRLHVSLTTTDFDECGQWLTAIKRIIQGLQQIRV